MELPLGWASTTTANCFSQISTAGKNVKTKECSPQGKYPVIDQGMDYISGYIDDSSKIIEIDEPVMVFGDHTRIVKWVDFNFVPGADGTKILKALPSFYPRFAYHQLRFLEIPDKGYSRHFKFLKDLDFLVPPFVEQKAIADIIDKLLIQVESTKIRLERVPKLLKQFRQSVLTAAVSGKLTEKWRITRDVSHDSWRKTTFSSICKEITVGYVGKMTDKYQESGVVFLRSQNIRSFKFSPLNLLHISEDFHQEIYKSRLMPGDLAIVRSGAPGTTCVIPDFLGPANCSDLVIARPSSELNSEFGCIFMNSEVAQKNVSDNQVGVAQQHFNVGSMKKMPINLPSLEEQKEIVLRVNELFAYADTIEKQVNGAVVRINNLTQSILAKAFRGGLTEQWRKDNYDLISEDNSAGVLLEKIKAERGEAKSARRDKGKS